MSEFYEDDDTTYEPEEAMTVDYTPTPHEQLNEAFFADPATVTNAVVQQAAHQRALELATVIGQQHGQDRQQFGHALATQSAMLADQAMAREYGDEWVKRRTDAADWIANRPYLNADCSTPDHAADLMETAFLAVRSAAQQRDDASEWQRIKQNGRPLDGYSHE